MVLRYFGVEGVSYTMENGIPKFVENITNNKDGVSIMEMAQRYSRAMGASPGYSDHETYKNLLDQVYVYDRQKEAFFNMERRNGQRTRASVSLHFAFCGGR